MRDLVVIGAGPAGMAGALAAAEAGLDVLVIDEQARAGGQIFRRPPAEFGEKHGKYAPYTWAAELIERFEAHPRIEACFRSTVYGVLRDREEEGSMRLQVAVHTPGGGELVETKRILLATGAYDMSVAFPGWTKPGVMMAGAVQSLLKSQKVLAGRNLVLAGSHPLLLVLAEQLLDAGANIAELAFARGLPGIGEMIVAAPAAPGHLGVFVEAGKAVAKIASRGVKVTTRTIVTEAFSDAGGSSVNGVGLVKVDSQWRPTGEVRRVESDLLVVGYGFTPSTELARQAGCAMQWDSQLGGWVVQHTDRFETTAEGIYVAGEPTGVSGAEQSWAEGRVAGLRIAEGLVGGDSNTAARIDSELRLAERKLRGAGRFSKVVQSMFEPNRHALAELSAHDGTLVCRCELVATETIDGVLDANPFVSSANAVKLECRSGMGPCQGRYCEGTVTARVAKARGISFDEVGHFTAHLPVKPVPVEAYRQLGHAPE